MKNVPTNERKTNFVRQNLPHGWKISVQRDVVQISLAFIFSPRRIETIPKRLRESGRLGVTVRAFERPQAFETHYAVETLARPIRVRPPSRPVRQTENGLPYRPD